MDSRVFGKGGLRGWAQGTDESASHWESSKTNVMDQETVIKAADETRCD